MEKIVLKRIIVGILETNCYIVGDKATNEAIIVDPGDEADRIKYTLNKLNLTPIAIVNTHGHGDHIGANKDFDLPIFIHQDDEDFLLDPEKNLSAEFGLSIVSPEASKLLVDGDIIELGSLKMEVIHTPGHTPGGICLKFEDFLLSGDTLFSLSVGRSDFEYGSADALIKSIKNKLLIFDDNTNVYPGHGPSTTIGIEKRHNFFLTPRDV